MRTRKVTQVGLALLLAAVIALASLVATRSGLAAGSGTAEERRSEAQSEEPAAAGYDLSWWTVDGGGATAAVGGDYTLGGTAGQPDATVWSGGGYTLTGGFWGGVLVEHHIYLPLVMRSP